MCQSSVFKASYEILEVHLFFPKKDTTLVLRNALRLHIKDVPFSNDPRFDILTISLNKYFGIE